MGRIKFGPKSCISWEECNSCIRHINCTKRVEKPLSLMKQSEILLSDRFHIRCLENAELQNLLKKRNELREKVKIHGVCYANDEHVAHNEYMNKKYELLSEFIKEFN